MIEEREQRLARLKGKKISVSDADAFIKSLDVRVKQISETLGGGVTLNNIDSLVKSLEEVHALNGNVKELKAAFANLDIPDSIEISGIKQLFDAVDKMAAIETKVNVQWLDEDKLSLFISKFDQLNQGIKAIKVDNGQETGDYLPFRRVRKVANGLIWDDSVWFGTTGGGGGASDLLLGNTIHPFSISINTQGDNILVAGVASRKIKLLSLAIISAGTVNWTWKSTGNLSGALPLIANTGYVLPASSPGQGHYLESDTGGDLVATLSAGTLVTGHGTYYLE